MSNGEDTNAVAADNGEFTLELAMTSAQARRFLNRLREDEFNDWYCLQPVEALASLGIGARLGDESMAEQAPDEPAVVDERGDVEHRKKKVPKGRDLEKIIEAIQYPDEDPPAFAACSRITIIAYAAAASSP